MEDKDKKIEELVEELDRCHMYVNALLEKNRKLRMINMAMCDYCDELLEKK